MKNQHPFYGRKEELKILKEEFDKKSSSLIVIHGRRRIGKSRLIEEFGQNLNTVHLSGLPPTIKTTNVSEQLVFSRQMTQALKIPLIRSEDWSELFWHLSRETASGKWLIVFDEISWMGSKDPDFLGKLKNAWDLQFSKNPHLMLIICGSVSSWIEKNILSNTGFLGRISIDLVLEELPLIDCLKFWRKTKERLSPYEFFKVLSVTGGVPKYLEEILPEQSAETNIQRLCFKPQGLLFREFEQIFSDLFSRRSALYKKIISLLVNTPQTLDELCKKLKMKKGGVLSGYLSNLEEAGFIKSDWTWNIKSHKISNLRKYRIIDNYIRFYLKYIAPKKALIQQQNFAPELLTCLPSWNVSMGYQFENLVIANRKSLYQSLQLKPSDVLIANPFFQRKTNRTKGCQIDFMIQTRQRNLYLIEIKFSESKIGTFVLKEIQEKMQRITLPRGVSIRTALVHINGVTEEVKRSPVLDFIVDFSDLLKGT